MGWSVLAYVTGVVVGELVGNPIYRALVARLERQRQDPAFEQNWEPSHPGWWICLLIFVVGTAIGILRTRRQKREADPPAARV
ncbi:hypothetical protein [Ornithinimicrobium sp. Y1694]|uniref:hypothetical protein n=1 Tax=Ornithinimicrobium sp. Y1694 TaxID=3418590 RepID=UPI003CF21645